MKILVTFQPNTKTYEFEGARVRKTIKGALEMVNVEYTTSIVDTFDVMHPESVFFLFALCCLSTACI